VAFVYLTLFKLSRVVEGSHSLCSEVIREFIQPEVIVSLQLREVYHLDQVDLVHSTNQGGILEQDLAFEKISLIQSGL
jgi:hypothetical protein